MNDNVKALISGMAGAVALTTLHQTLKKYLADAPRVDLIGSNAVRKISSLLHLKTPDKATAYRLSMAGDLIFNSFYYSLTATGKKPLISGSLLGAGAGTGVISLPGPLNLGKNLSSRNIRQALLSFGIYLAGGLTAGGVYKLLSKT